MSTKSIFKNIHIKDENSANKLLDALEKSKYINNNTNKNNTNFTELSNNDIFKYFNKKKLQ